MAVERNLVLMAIQKLKSLAVRLVPLARAELRMATSMVVVKVKLMMSMQDW